MTRVCFHEIRYRCDSREAHERLVRSWEEECAGDWVLAPSHPYFDEYLPFHLEQAGRVKESEDLLRDIDWLERTHKQEQARSMPAYSERSRYRSQGPWRWLNVSGTGAHEIPAVLEWTAERLGREAARHNFGLITGGWSGVDHVASHAFAAELKRIGVQKPDQYLLQIVESGRKPDFAGGSVVVEKYWNRAIVQRSSAVILVGGMGGTYQVGSEARKQGRLLLALRGTGGDAEKLAQESPNPDPVFDGAIRSEIEAGKIAAAAVAFVSTVTTTAA